MAAPTPVEMLDRLVAFDTVSERSNLALIDFADDYLRGHGFVTRRIANADGGKANLLATVGPADRPGVVLSGHTDVVPVAGQPWRTDPFKLTREGSRLYGRGSADMKGFIATALALAPELAAADLKVPVHLALSYDEEIGCFGVGSMIDDLCSHYPRPRLAIVGEPTSMGIVNAHKGIYVFETEVTGREAHSSQPHRGTNAVMAAAELMHEINLMAAEKVAAPSTAEFEPPYTTFNIGAVHGGEVQNILTRQCRFLWEYRLLPGDDAAAIKARFDRRAGEVLAEMRPRAPETAIDTRPIAEVPALVPEPDSPAEDLVRRLTGANRTTVVSFGAEAGLFQNAGMSTVMCGPGNIDQAHQPDEFVEETQIDACHAFLRRLVAWASA